jgi:uncharacterized protein HemY
MNSLISRTLVVGLLLLFSWLAWQENGKPPQPVPAQVSLTEDGSGPPEPAIPEGGYRNPVVIFTYILFIAITGGVVVLKWLIPAIGDRLAESFYSAPEKAEQTATQKAMALVAQGEYHRALAAFQRIREENPADRFAVMEAVKIYQQRLGDIESAAELLESAVAREWPADDKCFLLVRLADLHATERGDFARARALLEQLMRDYPGSNHAANAHHKLQEIEEQAFLAGQQQT